MHVGEVHPSFGSQAQFVILFLSTTIIQTALSGIRFLFGLKFPGIILRHQLGGPHGQDALNGSGRHFRLFYGLFCIFGVAAFDASYSSVVRLSRTECKRRESTRYPGKASFQMWESMKRTFYVLTYARARSRGDSGIGLDHGGPG